MTKPKPKAAARQADFLDGYLAAPAADHEQPRRRAKAGQQDRQQAQRAAEPGRRQRVTVYIDAAQFAEVRGAAVLLAANGIEPGTVSAIVEDALARELERLRSRHNGGKAFPSLPGLPGGRPRGPR